MEIVFDHDVQRGSFWYSSSINYTFWCYGYDSCGYGQYCEVGGPLKPNPDPRSVKFVTPQGTLGGQIVLDQPGTRSETGCSGDPLGSACKWTYVDFGSDTPLRGIRFDIGALGPFFMDDLQVCTDPTPTLRASWGHVKAIYR